MPQCGHLAGEGTGSSGMGKYYRGRFLMRPLLKPAVGDSRNPEIATWRNPFDTRARGMIPAGIVNALIAWAYDDEGRITLLVAERDALVTAFLGTGGQATSSPPTRMKRG